MCAGYVPEIILIPQEVTEGTDRQGPDQNHAGLNIAVSSNSGFSGLSDLCSTPAETCFALAERHVCTELDDDLRRVRLFLDLSSDDEGDHVEEGVSSFSQIIRNTNQPGIFSLIDY
ncbi:hypothetical protein MTP99_013832 [Tenebrio molitor]|nr:hypothetical protein MTP99_013832 [Tenebrio molitor]